MEPKSALRLQFLVDTFNRYGALATCHEAYQFLKEYIFRTSSRDGLFCYSVEKKSAKQMWVLFVLLVVSVSSVGFALKGTYRLLIDNDVYAVTDPLKSIRINIKRTEHKKILNELTLSQKRRVASQVHFVSELIGNINKKVDEKELAVSIVSESVRANYDPLFIAAIVNAESTFIKSSISTKGARGLMQLLPDTAHFVQQNLVSQNQKGFFKGDIQGIDMNLKLGIAYLKHLEKQFNGDKELALIAYNWGPGNVLKALKTQRHIPKEVVKYARKIIRNHGQWRGQLDAKKRQLQFFEVDGIA